MTAPLSLAPIRGITDATFRDTFASFFPDFDLAVAPFLTTYQGNRVKPARLQELLPENNQRLPVIPQILGKNPDHFIVLARLLIDMGYTTINWNLGCPYPMVANKMRGSGLLPYPDKIDAFLEKIHCLPAQFSIKTRLGRKNKAEIFDLLPVFNQYPLAHVIIHPRTGVQMYDGTVDLETFSLCLDQCRHPVIYNGDIIDSASFHTLAHRFPKVKGWMIGRGALANPFLCAQIKGKQLPEAPIKTLAAFHDEIFSRYQKLLHGPSHLLGRMKGLWFYLAGSFDTGQKILKKIQKTKSINRYQELTEHIFSEAVWNPGHPGDEI